MILERFDGVVFIGDGLVRNIYVAFNSLLRQNLALGGLRQWDMDSAQSASCKCENQFIKPECSGFAVTSSEEVTANGPRRDHSSPYTCGGMSCRQQHNRFSRRGAPWSSGIVRKH